MTYSNNHFKRTKSGIFSVNGKLSGQTGRYFLSKAWTRKLDIAWLRLLLNLHLEGAVQVYIRNNVILCIIYYYNSK